LPGVRRWIFAGAVTCALVVPTAAGAQVPQPFPQPKSPAPPPPAQPSGPPAAPAGTSDVPAADGGPTEAELGIPLYPGAQFIASYDAGRGQRFYLYGSSASFVDLVTFYRSVLKQRGSLVYEVPATHQFDVGRFRDETMAFPPGVTIKDFESETSKGYPNPKPGTEPERFPSIIQIVPAVPEE
jgi:hypothetical protein